MTSNQIIKELLARLYLLHPHIELIQQSYSLSQSLSEPRNGGEAPPDDWLNLALGGEAKALWDMVNESPYTPLETELLQRLDVVSYVKGKGEGYGFVDNWLAYAIYAPTERIKGFSESGSFVEWGLPWVVFDETWEQYKDEF